MSVTSRRGFIFGAGAIASCAVATPFASAALRDDGDPTGALVGTVLSSRADQLEVRTAEGDRSVVLSPGASVSRGPIGPLEDLTPFVAGDRIVAEGSPGGRKWTATAVGSAFEQLHVDVESVDRSTWTIESQNGPIAIGRLRAAEGRVSRETIRPGDHISGLMWTDPAVGIPEAVLVVRG